MKLDNRLKKLEEVVGEDVEVSDEQYEALLIPIIEASRDGLPRPCSEELALAIIKRWLDECARQPLPTFKQEV